MQRHLGKRNAYGLPLTFLLVVPTLSHDSANRQTHGTDSINHWKSNRLVTGADTHRQNATTAHRSRPLQYVKYVLCTLVTEPW